MDSCYMKVKRINAKKLTKKKPKKNGTVQLKEIDTALKDVLLGLPNTE